MSLLAPDGPPPQLALFSDGGAAGVVNRHAEGAPPPGYLDWMTSALPYHLRRPPRVLVLGTGGGTGVLQALGAGAAGIDAVERDAKIVRLLEGPLAQYAGELARHPAVALHVAEPRAFVTQAERRWDVIQISLVDSFGVASTGLGALGESPLFTVEGVAALLQRLTPGGVLVVTRWLKLPPRDSLKLLATVAEALRQAGIDSPERRLAMVRGWKTTTLAVKNGILGDADIQAVRGFARKRGFDLVYLPGMAPEEANRFNRLPTPLFFESARALLGGEEKARDFRARYRYAIAPATDDRPYFFDFFRWGLLPDLVAARGGGGLGLIEWGYPVAVATLAQALVFAVPLILFPLWIIAWMHPKTEGTVARRNRVGTLIYFLAIGFAFMSLEVAFLHRLTVFLGQPVLATAIVLAGFLGFAGLGARLSVRFASVGPAVAAIGGVAFLWLLVLEPLFGELAGLPTVARALVALVVIAPLALFMGIPFPVGLSRLAGDAATASLLPWAWAINGCASVAGALAASILAVTFGHSAVVGGAVMLYGLAVAGFPLLFGSRHPTGEWDREP